MKKQGTCLVSADSRKLCVGCAKNRKRRWLGWITLTDILEEPADSGGFYRNFTFEKRDSADRVLTALRKARPEVPQKPED